MEAREEKKATTAWHSFVRKSGVAMEILKEEEEEEEAEGDDWLSKEDEASEGVSV